MIRVGVHLPMCTLRVDQPNTSIFMSSLTSKKMYTRMFPLPHYRRTIIVTGTNAFSQSSMKRHL